MALQPLEFFTIVERNHTFQNPTSIEKLDRMLDYCQVADGQRVLDIGCGKAWLLRRMAQRWAIDAVGIDRHADFLAEAQAAIAAQSLQSRVQVLHQPATSFTAEPASFDLVMCIGASFAIGTFDEMLAWMKPLVKPGGMLAIGDIYARYQPVPAEAAVHFAGGRQRSLAETAVTLDQEGLTLTGVIDSSLEDWDHYESLHWQAAERWLATNPDHPDRAEFAEKALAFKRDHLNFDRSALGWALFTARKDGAQ